MLIDIIIQKYILFSYSKQIKGLLFNLCLHETFNYSQLKEQWNVYCNTLNKNRIFREAISF